MKTDLSFIDKLGMRLTQPLPGEKAQNIMAPSSRKIPAIYLNKEAIPRMSSVMIMLYAEEAKWKFPLIQRPHYTGVHSGQMALPGGRMEKTDQNRIDTAIRETREEIGVEMGNVRILGTLTELNVIASQHRVLPVVCYIPGIPDYFPDKVEVDSIHVVLLEDILDEKRSGVTTIPVTSKISIEAPFYDIEGRIVWGATAMILSEFLYIVREINDDK